ncbi:TraI domain-containing protein [Morganella morganii]|uniref:TraI domain-containing protein n=1 Tax=Morganella morganii TaxID=582 RepID=UPI003F2076F1
MRCLTLMQQFPLTAERTHARSGGMADYMLESLSYAVRLAKGHMLPAGKVFSGGINDGDNPLLAVI